MSDTVNDVFRSGAFGAVIPPAPASPTAQSDNTGGPLSIRHIKRGHAFTSLTGVDNITVTSTEWSEVDPQLRLTIATSGRPLLMQAQCMGVGKYLSLSFFLDGDNVTDAAAGLVQGDVAPFRAMPLMWVAEPLAGTHTVSLAAKTETSYSGTIYCADDVIVLAAREV